MYLIYVSYISFAFIYIYIFTIYIYYCTTFSKIALHFIYAFYAFYYVSLHFILLYLFSNVLFIIKIYNKKETYFHLYKF